MFSDPAKVIGAVFFREITLPPVKTEEEQTSENERSSLDAFYP
jgi:hypothetical protein